MREFPFCFNSPVYKYCFILFLTFVCQYKITGKMKIAIGNDHAGTDYKFAVMTVLRKMGFEVKDHGTGGITQVDYPDFVHPVANAVEEKTADFGVVICGSGNGAAMTANKHAKIRAALCWTKELAELARQHNDANMLCIPARFTAIAQAEEITRTFMETKFEGGRHKKRIEKIPL